MVIEHVPTFEAKEGTTQMLITSLDFSSFTGRIAIGRLLRGSLKEGQQVSLVKRDGKIVKTKIKELLIVIEKKLSNDKFIDNAPSKVVEGEKEKEITLKDELEKINSNLGMLSWSYSFS